MNTEASSAETKACDDRHEFPRDTFARLAKVVVFCDKPAGHAGPHEGIKGSTAFTWGKAEKW